MEMRQMNINYDDKFFNDVEHQIIYDYCMGAEYSYGESDNKGLPVTGMIHNIPETEFVYKIMKKTIYDRHEKVQQMKLYRMYVNCFANMNWDLQEGGETQFYINNDIYGITPVPNRMVVFDANIQHRATTFRNDHRFTVAIKYT